MQNHNILRKEFLKKWIMGLQESNFSKNNMNILERKKAIKLSADLAMASTRKGRTCWSRSVIADALKEDDNQNRLLVEYMFGRTMCERFKRVSNTSMKCNMRRLRSKKILQRSGRRFSPRVGKSIAEKKAIASSIAKRLVEKKTKLLRGLIPGGESMDESYLIEETLDYIASLRAQVEAMRFLAYVNYEVPKP